jgi:hypothetical protein
MSPGAGFARQFSAGIKRKSTTPAFKFLQIVNFGQLAHYRSLDDKHSWWVIRRSIRNQPSDLDP